MDSSKAFTRLRPGLTLAEVVIGLTIIGFITLLVIAVYFAYFRLFSNQNTAIDIASQNKIALDEIANQIREGESVVTTCTNCGGDTTGSQVLVLRLWTLNANGEPQDPGAGTYDYIVYKRDSADYTKFIKKIIADATSTRAGGEKLIATNISDLEFAYNNADPTAATEITVTITTTANSLTKTHTNTLSIKALLRNK